MTLPNTPSTRSPRPITPRGRQRWSGARVGLLGGSFNPAHQGHVKISEAALEQLGLDAVWWLVSPLNPLKSAKDMAPQDVRLAYAAQVAQDPRIWPTDIERHFGTRYTVDTLAALRSAFPETHFIWLMGADSLAGFHFWRAWRRIAMMLPIAVLLRPGYTHARWSAPVMTWLAKYRQRAAGAKIWPTWPLPAVVVLNLAMDASSATAIRAKMPGWAKTLSKTVAAKSVAKKPKGS